MTDYYDPIDDIPEPNYMEMTPLQAALAQRAWMERVRHAREAYAYRRFIGDQEFLSYRTKDPVPEFIRSELQIGGPPRILVRATEYQLNCDRRGHPAQRYMLN